jgi:membrane protein implicated in regulation of membrane protease activity
MTPPGRGELSIALICALAAIWPAFSGAPTWSVVLFLALAALFTVAGLRARRRAAEPAASGRHGRRRPS